MKYFFQEQVLKKAKKIRSLAHSGESRLFPTRPRPRMSITEDLFSPANASKAAISFSRPMNFWILP